MLSGRNGFSKSDHRVSTDDVNSSKIYADQSGLLKEEKVLDRLDCLNECTFILTDLRIIYMSSVDVGVVFASARLEHVTVVMLERRTRGWLGLIWPVLGFGAGFGIWQTAASPTLGAIMGLVLVGAASLLVLDYLFRSANEYIKFFSSAQGMEGRLQKHDNSLQRFVAAFEDARAVRLGTAASQEEVYIPLHSIT